MGVRQYQLGKRHAILGIRAMAHRKCRRYDSENDNRSYNNGYHAGVQERLKNTGKISLDYTQPLNNQRFPD